MHGVDKETLLSAAYCPVDGLWERSPLAAKIAGAYFGVEAIPAKWRENLTMTAEITSMADSLYAHARRSMTK